MLELHRQLPQAKAPAQREPLERQVAATDRAIDALVYELYGLTDEEIAIVEAAGRWGGRMGQRGPIRPMSDPWSVGRMPNGANASSHLSEPPLAAPCT